MWKESSDSDCLHIFHQVFNENCEELEKKNNDEEELLEEKRIDADPELIYFEKKRIPIHQAKLIVKSQQSDNDEEKVEDLVEPPQSLFYNLSMDDKKERDEETLLLTPSLSDLEEHLPICLEESNEENFELFSSSKRSQNDKDDVASLENLTDSAYSSKDTLCDWSDDYGETSDPERPHESPSIEYVPVSYANVVLKKRKIRLRRHSSANSGDYYFCRTYPSTRCRSLRNLFSISGRKKSAMKHLLDDDNVTNDFYRRRRRREPGLAALRTSVKRFFRRICNRSATRNGYNVWVRSWSTPTNLDRI